MATSVSGSDPIAVIGPGRIGRQIALAFALGGHRVLLVDLKDRGEAEAPRVFADARREVARDLGFFEFIDWGGLDILYRAGRFRVEALGDGRFLPPRLVEEKMARGELGPKTGRGFFPYEGSVRDEFETRCLRALLRRLKTWRAEEGRP